MSQNALRQWQELKFGMFIHWGIYSIPAKGEWHMYYDKTPVKEYEKLAAEFNPQDFCAEDWVLLAKAAGMKYIILTTKHHDGFSMFKTAVSAFNVVDGTPFGRDVVAELAEACRRHNMKLGLYYSHVREWRHPLAQSLEKRGRDDRFGNYGNFWDYPDESVKDLDRYINEFDKPQLDELLSNYGDILTIWFDTPSHINTRQAEDLRKFVYARQPNCLVNSRLGCPEHVHCDYISMGDNSIPLFSTETPWETAATSSDAWGYIENSRFLPHTEILRKFVEILSKGGNFLLNEAPDRNGHIPQPAQDELRAVGNWITRHTEAVYGVRPLYLPYVCDWGYAAQKNNTIYLYITDVNATQVGLTGLLTQITCCREVDGNALLFSHNNGNLSIHIDNAKNEEVRVIAVDLSGPAVIQNGIYANDSGCIYLTTQNAVLNKNDPYSHTEITNLGMQRWLSNLDTLSWQFTVSDSGNYTAEIITADGGLFEVEDTGHEITLLMDDTPVDVIVEGILAPNGKRITTIPKIPLDTGAHTLQIIPRRIVDTNRVGFTFAYLRLFTN